MILTLYLAIITILSFILMGIDKRRAVKQKWRISESTLWVTAILGGSLGSLFGMHVFRHKTKHRVFTIGIPILLFIQILGLFFILQMS